MNKTSFEQKVSTEDELSLWVALRTIFLVSVVIAIAFGIATFFNDLREKKIIDKYTKETRELIEKNEQGFIDLFTVTMDFCDKELRTYNNALAREDIDTVNNSICPTAQKQLEKIKVDRLKDSSSVVYLRVSDYEYELYELLEASGTYNISAEIKGWSRFAHTNIEDLRDYLIEGKPITMWEDYISFISGKEVIVPVKDGDKIVGYIFRGVIEK